MSNAIDRPGSFRCKILDHGVSETKNGYPQWVVSLQAVEFYDEQAGEYIPWVEYDQTITAYQVLYTKDKQGQWQELLNAKQAKKITAWTGLDFESLAAMNLATVIVLARIQPSEYNGNTSLKVEWLDTADANPVKTLPKFDTDKLKGLTAKLGGALTQTAQAPTPAKAPTPATAKPPKKAAAPKAGPGVPPAKPPIDEKLAAPSAESTPPAAGAPSTPAPSGKATPPVTTPTPASEPVTKDSAWAAVNAISGVDDKKLAEVWIAEATKIGKPEDQFTPTDWATVKDAVIAQTSKF